MKETDCRKCCVCAFKEDLCNGDFCEKYYREGNTEDFEKLLPHWIPCSERLPKYGEPVLWCNEKGSVFTTAITFVNERGDFAVGKRHRRYSVVAWQPLPEPYRGEQE